MCLASSVGLADLPFLAATLIPQVYLRQGKSYLLLSKDTGFARGLGGWKQRAEVAAPIPVHFRQGSSLVLALCSSKGGEVWEEGHPWSDAQ